MTCGTNVPRSPHAPLHSKRNRRVGVLAEGSAIGPSLPEASTPAYAPHVAPITGRKHPARQAYNTSRGRLSLVGHLGILPAMDFMRRAGGAAGRGFRPGDRA